VSERQWNKETVDGIRAALFQRKERTVLVQGGPGSGKTYTAVLLALEAAARLEDNQRALVLTFTVSAVDQIQTELDKTPACRREARKRVEIINYHAFYKRLLDAYAHYCGIRRKWQTWLPHEVEEFLKERHADILTDDGSEIDRGKQWEASNATSIAQGLMDSRRPEGSKSTSVSDAADWLNKQYAQGRLHYDSWPYFSYRILAESAVLRGRMAKRYPFIFIDEFQDTNGIEWEFIRQLASDSTLICMADPNQAVYEWRGARPQARLEAFCRERDLNAISKYILAERPRSERNKLLAEFADTITCACERPPNAGDLRRRFRAVAEVRTPTRPCKAEIAGYCKGEWPRTYVSRMKREARQLVARGCRVAVLCPTWLLLGLVSHALNAKYDGSEPLPHAIVGIEEDTGAFLSVLANALAARLGTVPATQAALASELALEHLERTASDHDHKSIWFGPSKTAQLRVKSNETRRSRILSLLHEYSTANSSPAPAILDLARLSEQIRNQMAPRGGIPIWLADPALPRHTSRYVSALAQFARRSPEASPTELLSFARRALDAAVAVERRHVARSRLLLMTAHAAKGKEVDFTYVLAASAGTPLFNPRSVTPVQCEAARNLFHVACSRSREKVIILYKQGHPCCILSRLMGNPCPLLAGPERGERTPSLQATLFDHP